MIVFTPLVKNIDNKLLKVIPREIIFPPIEIVNKVEGSSENFSKSKPNLFSLSLFNTPIWFLSAFSAINLVIFFACSSLLLVFFSAKF